jgi:hypothetical protein
MNGSANGHRMLYTSGAFSSSSTAAAFNVSCDPHAPVPVPLTLALVWTHPPGGIYSDKQLVNDLDLIVLLPAISASQLFGNMRAAADQLNTVERVVTKCPASGFVTAVVAPGNPLKTSSQAWYLVANGAVLRIDSLPTLPTYRTGRVARPQTQSQSCILDAGIAASVKFKPSRGWSCHQSVGDWDCDVKRRVVVTMLAQTFGVAAQSFGKANTDSTGLSMTLYCSAMVNGLSGGDAASLQYVSAQTLQNHIWSLCNADVSVCDSDPVLGAFDWSTFVARPSTSPTSALTTLSITAYDDAVCSMKSSSYLSAPNPLVFTDQGCTPGPLINGIILYVKAVSCSSANVTFQLTFNVDKSCPAEGIVSLGRGVCGQITDLNKVVSSDVWVIASCTPPSHPCKFGKLCLLIPDSALYAIVAALLLHLLQAAIWVVISKRKLLFSVQNLLIAVFIPVFGLVTWLPLCRSYSSTARRGGTLLQDMNPRSSQHALLR